MINTVTDAIVIRIDTASGGVLGVIENSFVIEGGGLEASGLDIAISTLTEG